MAGEPSVLPLSAMMISPRTPARSIPRLRLFDAARERFRLVQARHDDAQFDGTGHGRILFKRPGVWRAWVLGGGSERVNSFQCAEQAPTFRSPTTQFDRWVTGRLIFAWSSAAQVSSGIVHASCQMARLTTIHSRSSGSRTNGWARRS